MTAETGTTQRTPRGLRSMGRWISLWLLALMVTAAAAHGQSRYDNLLFVCRSLDPTGSPLNRRSQPHGAVLGVIGRKTAVYVFGRDLRQPVRGYVPIHFSPPGPPHSPAPQDGKLRQPRPDGWVWKAYLRCELSS